MASNISSKAVTVSADITTGGCTYYGYSIRESASSAAVATVRIRDGGSTGKIIDVIELAANGFAQAHYGPQGLKCSGGLYIEVVAGTIEGSVRFG